MELIRDRDRFASFEDALSTLRYPYGYPRTGTPGTNYLICDVDSFLRIEMLLSQSILCLEAERLNQSEGVDQGLVFMCPSKLIIAFQLLLACKVQLVIHLR
jgi:hypothetical protein